MALGPALFPLLPDSRTIGTIKRASVLAAVRPVQSLATSERMFDELRYSVQSFVPTLEQWARLQTLALRTAIEFLEMEAVRKVGVPLSISSVLRMSESMAGLLVRHYLTGHRLTVILCGALAPTGSPYLVRSFIGFLRAHHVTVGFRALHGSPMLEQTAITLCEPDFLCVAAPDSTSAEAWGDLLQDVSTVGVSQRSAIVGGLDRPDQRALATVAGFSFGQGDAVQAAYVPRSRRAQAVAA